MVCESRLLPFLIGHDIYKIIAQHCSRKQNSRKLGNDRYNYYIVS